MSENFITQAHSVSYVRYKQVAVTFADGSQRVFDRPLKEKNSVASSLDEWHAAGFLTPDRDTWAPRVALAEHARILRIAGITPEMLGSLQVNRSNFHNVAQWFNVFAAHQQTDNTTSVLFAKFIKAIRAIPNAERLNPIHLSRMVQLYSMDKVGKFVFLIDSDEWLDAAAAYAHIIRSEDVIKTMMRVGMPARSLTYIFPRVLGMNHASSSALVDAIGRFYSRGLINETIECWKMIRALAEILPILGRSNDEDSFLEIIDMFFREDVSSDMLHSLVLDHSIDTHLYLKAALIGKVNTVLLEGIL